MFFQKVINFLKKLVAFFNDGIWVAVKGMKSCGSTFLYSGFFHQV